MKELLANLKTDLKALAVDIRNLKKTRKQCSNGYVPGLFERQHDFRVKHVFRCLIRGRTLEQIESSRVTAVPPISHYPEQILQRSLSHLFMVHFGTDYSYQGIECRCQTCRKVRDEQARCNNQAG